MGVVNGESWSWSFEWKRVFCANEFCEFLEFWNCVCRFKLSTNSNDSFRWKKSPNGLFSTRSMYESLLPLSIGDANTSGLSKVWWKAIPIKVSAFCWKLLQNRIPTKDNLSQRGIVRGGESSDCALCSEYVETARHLMIECNLASQVWSQVSSWLNCSHLPSSELQNHFQAFIMEGHGKEERRAFKLIWQCIVWRIWKGRNDVIFNSVDVSITKIVEGVKLSSWKWLRAHFSRSFCVSYNDWCISPRDCIPSSFTF